MANKLNEKLPNNYSMALVLYSTDMKLKLKTKITIKIYPILHDAPIPCDNWFRDISIKTEKVAQKYTFSYKNG